MQKIFCMATGLAVLALTGFAFQEFGCRWKYEYDEDNGCQGENTSCSHCTGKMGEDPCRHKMSETRTQNYTWTTTDGVLGQKGLKNTGSDIIQCHSHQECESAATPIPRHKCVDLVATTEDGTEEVRGKHCIPIVEGDDFQSCLQCVAGDPWSDCGYTTREVTRFEKCTASTQDLPKTLGPGGGTTGQPGGQ